MNTVNASTGISPFVLKTGHSLHVILPLNIASHDIATTDSTPEDEKAQKCVEDMEEEMNMAKDNLLAAKLHQAHKIGQWTLLTTSVTKYS